MMEDTTQKLMMIQEFTKVFGDAKGAAVYIAPGRVNLIGEHTDYNGGHVFPCALTIGTYCAARKNNLNQIRVYSMNFESKGIISINKDQIVYDQKNHFGNYPFGVVATLLEAGYPVTGGLDLCYYGNIPNSSGLSSSASIEVVTAYAASKEYGFDLDFVTMAKLTQKAENQFIGVNCGIMDQFAIAMGKKDNAIFLDTADLSYEYAPIVLEDSKIVIACSNKKRGLSDSKYNERRSECEEAVRILNEVTPIHALGELSSAQFTQVQNTIKDEVIRRRAKHAVTENERTILAVTALKQGDIELFGRLMIESHNSLRDDYEVTGIELDTLVEEALKVHGVIGSRMTGAGFGGCTVSIVKNDAVDEFIQSVGDNYQKKIGYSADFYVVSVGCGPYTIQ